jgi:peptidoglycan/LPS O-acetylase OafA/YrhL
MIQQKTYFPNLDGLRFFSFLAVFFYHSFHTEYQSISSSDTYVFFKSFIFGNGNLGVNFFFVLSGFLITYLLMREKEITGRISLPSFYMRRTLRIWPLYFFCVFFGFVVFPYLKQLFGQVPAETANPLYYLVFLNNFDFINNGLPDAGILGILWSVGIEEQFYLIWPVILLITPKKFYGWLFSLIVLSSLIFRFLYDDPMMLEYHTLSAISDMAVGGFGAFIAFRKGKALKFFTDLPRWSVALIYIFVILTLLFRKDIMVWTPLRITERFLVSVIFLFVIMEQSFSTRSLFKLSRFRVLSYLGKISYGLYCFHMIGILIALTITKLLHFNTEIWQVMVVETVLALTIAIIISAISFRFFEGPILRLKDRFSVLSEKK